ncbi:MAG: 2TM domain-containing protein [Flavobacterium sp.]|nr:MAG: 2TM domain-containing protein [Flavobacterium sp.]
MENLDEMQRERFERARKRVKSIGGFYRHLMVYVVVNIALLAMSYFSKDSGENFWEFHTFSTAFFWGIGLMFHALAVFSKNVLFGNDWEERKIREYMDKRRTEKWE